MKLSICMMVKNEEKNLERCLNSLENLRKNISSELIIIDTGSVDSTVEISKKYTDNVYFHAWNNNFSEMRNISISYANGDWIFIIDADEELVDDKALIKALKAKKVSYNVIALTLKNIVSSTGKFGGDIITTRLFRNDGFFHYEGSVHNMPVFKGEGIKVYSTLYHYGYISDDMDLMEKKFDRTSKLLMDELDKDPDNIYYTFQLGSTYDMHKEDMKSEIYFSKAHEMAKKTNNLSDYLYVFGALSKVLLSNKKYEKAVEIAKEGLVFDRNYLDLLYYLGTSYLFLGELETGAEILEEYLIKKSNFNNLSISLNTSIQMYTLNAENESRQNLVKVYYKGSYYDKLVKHTDWLLDDMKHDSEDYESIVTFAMHSYIKLNETQSIFKLYERLDTTKWEFLDSLLYDNLKVINWHENTMMISTLSNLQSPIGQLFRSFSKEIDIDNIDAIKKCLELKYSEAFLVLIDNKVDVSETLMQLSEVTIMALFSDLNEKYSDFELKIVKYLEENGLKNDIRHLNVQRIMKKYLGITHFKDSNNMFEYFKTGMVFMKRKYSDEFMSQIRVYGYLSSEEQLLSLLCWAEENAEKVSSKTIEQAVSFFPEWSYHIYKWFDQLLSTDKEEDNVMSALLKVLKENILNLNSLGSFSDVLTLIEEYLNYKPDDLDIILLKSEVMVKQSSHSVH